MSPPMAHLLGLRRLLGLRSPVNTVARLLDPADASACVDGVFHPPYIALHLAVAERLQRRRLLVLKGGGGEAERPPAKPVTVHVHDRTAGRREFLLPALLDVPTRGPADTVELIVDLWHGRQAPESARLTVTGTIAMALLALRPGVGLDQADRDAELVWRSR